MFVWGRKGYMDVKVQGERFLCTVRADAAVAGMKGQVVEQLRPGKAVLASDEEVDIFRLTFRANVGINADNKYLMKPFSILPETSN